jgi:hypothetical protein
MTPLALHLAQLAVERTDLHAPPRGDVHLLGVAADPVAVARPVALEGAEDEEA